MQEPDKSLLELLIMGAFIGVAKLLLSSNELTFRVIFGRAIMGSATSLVAGVVLLQIPNINPLALLAIGSALGIVGQQYVEKLIKHRLGLLEKKGKLK